MNLKKLLISAFCALSCTAIVNAQDDLPTLGVGIILNGPTGITIEKTISGNIWLTTSSTFQFGEINRLYVQVDLNTSRSKNHRDLESGKLKAYDGIGLSANFTEGQNFYAVRAPLGVKYEFEKQPISTFLELAPSAWFEPDFQFFFAGAFGLRFYF
ncbi:MAG: hypothetical protein AAFW89_10080 [Bacteroidota bacterium]